MAAFIDARGVSAGVRSGSGENEAAIAIAALDEVLIAHFQPDEWMPQGAADAIASDAPRADGNDFRVRRVGRRGRRDLLSHQNFAIGLASVVDEP